MRDASARISKRQARRMALYAQMLDGRRGPARGKKGTVQIIEHLGYVQIDTIAVIERAHHHTIWTRQPDYTPDKLDELLAADRQVFEYWGHAASYLPMKDYRFFIPRMESFPWGDGWIKRMFENHKKTMKSVLERIRDEGPLGSADFKAPEGKKRGTWWDWKPAKTALELLMWRGDLMVTRRRNFARIYDLTERVLPRDADTRIPEPDEVARFRIERALQALGVATKKQITDHLHLTAGDRIPQALKDLISTGKVVKLDIQGIDKADYCCLRDILERVSRFRKQKPSLYFISPFDSMIIQRSRIRDLFDFSYALECYLPASKRKYGYFSLPVLWGENLVARLDPKADRKDGRFILRNLYIEPGFDLNDGFLASFSNRLKEFAEFNKCRRIEVDKTLPERLKSKILKTL